MWGISARGPKKPPKRPLALDHPPRTEPIHSQGENDSNYRTNVYPSINNSTSGKHRDPSAEGCGGDRRLRVDLQQLDRREQKNLNASSV